jgi:hypothetical protein
MLPKSRFLERLTYPPTSKRVPREFLTEHQNKELVRSALTLSQRQRGRTSQSRQQLRVAVEEHPREVGEGIPLPEFGQKVGRVLFENLGRGLERIGPLVQGATANPVRVFGKTMLGLLSRPEVQPRPD